MRTARANFLENHTLHELDPSLDRAELLQLIASVDHAVATARPRPGIANRLLMAFLLLMSAVSTFCAGAVYARMRMAGDIVDDAKRLHQVAAEHEARARAIIGRLQNVVPAPGPMDQRGFDR